MMSSTQQNEPDIFSRKNSFTAIPGKYQEICERKKKHITWSKSPGLIQEIT